MKKSLPLFVCFSAIGLLAVGSVNNNLNIAKASSGYSVATLPTTIDLNDSTETEVRSYYSGLSSLAATERKGNNLLKNLKPILMNGQKYFKYEDSASKDVWQIYEITDRDWEKSPASSTTYGTYDAANNKIVDYVYGTSNTNGKNNPYIHALYVNRDVDNKTQAWGNHNQDDWGINQEHVWAKSSGFDDDSTPVGARGDVMHLMAGNGRVNGQYHSNYYYGYVDTTKDFTDAGKDNKNYTNLTGNLKGFSKTLGGTETVFEPQDCDKGDIARALFYMAARYNNISGDDPNIDAGNPNLEIVDDTSSWAKSGYTSTATSTGKIGILSDLLEWNRIDPPDEWEIHRNNLIYKNYTNNRNPFVDFPEWADYIWGDQASSADPTSDALNGVNNDITISKQELNIVVTGTAQLSATTKDKSAVTWAITSGEDVISLDKTSSESGANINISALKVGSAQLKATAVIGEAEKTATIKISVKDKSEAIKAEKLNAEVNENEEITLSVDTLDGSEVEWTVTEGSDLVSLTKNGNKVTIKGLKTGNVKLTAKGHVNGVETTLEFNITVNAETIFGLPKMTFIFVAIGVGVVLLIILIIFISVASKKTKKKAASKAKKFVKKTVKTQTKSSNKKKR